MRRAMWGIVAIVLATAACDDSGGPVEPSPASGTMSAVIDGTPWTVTFGLTAERTGGQLAVAGADRSTAPQISAGFAIIVSGPGTYQLGPATGNAGVTIALANTQLAQTWEAVTQGSGSVTVNTLTATGASGTFQYTAAANAGTGATGSKTVTNGVFNVTFER